MLITIRIEGSNDRRPVMRTAPSTLKQEGKMPTGITDENIHYWPSSNGELMVSIEDTKTLMSFKTLDDAINWLYLKGFKKSARQIHGDWDD